MWNACPAPYQEFACPERLFSYGNIWDQPLANYEALWVNCDPTGTPNQRILCFEAYARYRTLMVIHDRYPVFELKPPKPLPSNL